MKRVGNIISSWSPRDSTQSVASENSNYDGAAAQQPLQPLVMVDFNVMLSSRYVETNPQFMHDMPKIYLDLMYLQNNIEPTYVWPQENFIWLQFLVYFPEDLLKNGVISYSYRVGENREAMEHSDDAHRELNIHQLQMEWSNNTKCYRVYDYVIRKDKDEYSEDLKVKSMISDDEVPKVVYDAEYAMLTFLPQWEGFTAFYIIGWAAKTSISRVKGIWKSFTTSQTVHTGTMHLSRNSHSLKPNGFDMHKVLVYHLSKKIDSYKDPFNMVYEEWEKQLISAVAVTELVNEYELDLPIELRRKLCMGLKFPFTVQEESIALLKKLRNEIHGNVGDSLAKLVRSFKDDMYEWMLILPLYHFTSQTSMPNAPVKITEMSATAEIYWGVQTLERVKLDTRQTYEICELGCFMNIATQLQPLMTTDPMLIRSIMWLFTATPCEFMHFLNNGELVEQAPVSLLCNGLEVSIRHMTMEDERQRKMLKEAINVLSRKLQGSKEDDLHPYSKLVETMQTRVRLEHEDIFQEGCVLFAKATSICKENAMTENTAFNNKQFESVCESVSLWLDSILPPDENKSFTTEQVFQRELKALVMVSTLISVRKDFPEKNGKEWVERLLEYLNERLKKMTNEHRVLFYCEMNAKPTEATLTLDVEVWQALLSTSKEAMENILCYDTSSESRDKLKDFEKRLSELLRKAFSMTTRWTSSPEEMVEEILKRRIFAVVFTIERVASSSPVHLEEDVKGNLKGVFNSFREICNRCTKGTIDVKSLKTILEYGNAFLTLFDIVNPNQDKMEVLLERRQLEIDAFETEWQINSNFCLKVCEGLKHKEQRDGQTVVSLADLEKKLTARKSEIKLTEVCDPAIMATYDSQNAERVQCKYFGHPQVVQEMLKPLHIVFQTSLFRYHIRKRVLEEWERNERRDLSPTELATVVWEPLKADLQRLVERIERSIVTTEELEKYLGHTRGDPDADIEADVKQLFKLYNRQEEALAKQRSRQIARYFSLRNIEETSTKILKKAKEYQLVSTSFALLDRLNRLAKDSPETSGETLGSIDDDIDSLAKMLSTLKEAGHLNHLDIFSGQHSSDLIEWIRQEIQDIYELHVFVDLCAEDTSPEFDTVLQLHHAARGYAPFIWDLHQDQSLKKFLEVIDLISEANAKDKNLQLQWQKTTEKLSTLKQAKSAMEISPRQQAESINNYGVYTIGNLNNNEVEDEDGNANLRLLVKHPTDGDSVFTLSQLKDLQTKLSLHVGKIQQENAACRKEIDEFTQIFSDMQSLAETYTKLCAAGNILFLDWKATFVCGSSDGQRTCLDFGFGDEHDEYKMYGNRPLKDELSCLLKVMKTCLQEWHRHVNEIRGKYYYVNYFTTQQLLHLSRYLARGEHQTKDPPPQLYALLSHLCVSTRWDSMQKSLLESMDSATQEIQNVQVNDREMQNKAARISRAVPSLSPARLLAALQELGTQRPDPEYVKWCMDNPTGGRNQAPIHSMTKSWKDIVTTLLTEVQTQSSPLDERLNSMWNEYLETTKCVDSEEYICLDYLGRILKHLALKDDIENVAVTRKLPQYLKKDQPNLVVSCARDVLRDVLAIYMHENGPLPTHEEVLICTKGTSLEEVCLLFRRAIGDCDRKRIFCLVNAERLEYHISRKAGDLLQDLLQTCTDGCRLVVICSQEGEHNAQMVTKLDQFRTDLPIEILTQLDVKEYLFKELKRRCSGVAAASHVTDLRSAAVAVISKTTGAGKSTIVAQFAETLRKKNPTDVTKTCVTIPFHNVHVNNEEVVRALLPHLKGPNDVESCIYHLDVAPMVCYGLDDLLFNLIVLGELRNKQGSVWRSRSQDLYVIEITDANLVDRHDMFETASDLPWFHTLLPHIICRQPQSVLKHLQTNSSGSGVPASRNGSNAQRIQQRNTAPRSLSSLGTSQEMHESWQEWDPRINQEKFQEPLIQCAFKFIHHLSTLSNREFNRYNVMEDTTSYNNVQILTTLLKNSGVEDHDPSWTELSHFAAFLSAQVEACETCVFTSAVALDDIGALSGFKKFVVEFMILMAKDFSTPSLNMSEATVTTGRLTRSISRYSHCSIPEEIGGDGGRSVAHIPETASLPHSPLESRVGFEDAESVAPMGEAQRVQDDLAQFTLKRRWEDRLHPYLFFNDDRVKTDKPFTFMGFVIDDEGYLKDHNGDKRKVIDPMLKRALERDGDLDLSVDFEVRCPEGDRQARLQALADVLGIRNITDPDQTYKLTADNVMKILAITMRFRCNIPVVITGETGSGKTRMIKFMCQLLAARESHDGSNEEIKNMILMKIHGGTTATDVAGKVQEAEETSHHNKELYGIDTVLFFDEANTTEAIGLIKEIMCDGRIQGRRIGSIARGALKVIASCNPYRRYSKEMLQHMESLGLGYHVQTQDVTDRLGSIPLREMVYRVHPLPQSMRSLVWDFGTLSESVEKKYIEQIVQEYVESEQIRADGNYRALITTVLCAAQKFMKEQKDECSFVSIRDVKRTLDVLVWFHLHQDILGIAGPKQPSQPRLAAIPSHGSHTENKEVTGATSMREYMREYITTQQPSRPSLGGIPSLESQTNNEEMTGATSMGERVMTTQPTSMSTLTRALTLALGVCYHTRLQIGRRRFRDEIATILKLPNGGDTMLEEIDRCQDLFLEGLDLGPNIARNAALKENVFMMVICIELRIPLFLVGEPGSSKSLAKTTVAKAMQGDYSSSELYRNLKQVHMRSCQCSRLSTSSDIQAVFDRCVKFQKDKDIKRFVSVAVLDEVGLAEDSPKMPLKILHPLLETSSLDDDETASKKVAFVGLSNWALDPAKMGRGIMVRREEVTKEDLIDTARGICSDGGEVEHLIPILADAYQEICNKQNRQNRKKHFFGLRDYYSLIKMLCTFSKKSKKRPTQKELEHSIKRNFSGLVQDGVPDVDNHNMNYDPIDLFMSRLRPEMEKSEDEIPDCSVIGLIQASMRGQPQILEKPTMDGVNHNKYSDSRYLLILTENYSALPLLQDIIPSDKTVVIFGSSFPNDQEFDQVCRDINRIKCCMQTGHTVVSLNLENLYGSLYEALNQDYSYFQKKRYVALGLGTQKVKCEVNKDFRLIVVADKRVVYDQFPIPLVNRLEKHFLTCSSLLSEAEMQIVRDVQEHFVQKFSRINPPQDDEHDHGDSKYDVTDAFVGYHNDVVASLVFHSRKRLKTREGEDGWEKELKTRVKDLLLQCATPEAILRLPYSELKAEYTSLHDSYLKRQKHESLYQYLHLQLREVRQKKEKEDLLVQVTTHSTLLLREDKLELAKQLNIQPDCLRFMYLKDFQTQQQCREEIRDFFNEQRDRERLLLVQCEDGKHNSRLIACTLYCILDEKQQASSEEASARQKPAHVVLVINLARMSSGFASYPGGQWQWVHIDDVHLPRSDRPQICNLIGLDLSSLFRTTTEDVELSPDELMLDSLHPAVSRIEDCDQSSNRTTDRIRVLHSVLTPRSRRGNQVSLIDDGGDGGGNQIAEKQPVAAGDQVEVVSTSQAYQLVGDNNMNIIQGPESSINFHLDNRFDLPVVLDIVNQSTRQVMPEVADRVYQKLKQEVETYIQQCQQFQNQNVLLRQQNQALEEQNALLRQALLQHVPQNEEMRQIVAGFGGELTQTSSGSIKLVVRFYSAENFERFWKASTSGDLAQELTSCLITDALEKQIGEKLAIQTTIKESDYMEGLKSVNTFNSVTKRYVSQLLEEKDEYAPKSIERNHDRWLSEKALAISDIQESGTFRRSLWRQLVASVTPFLSEIFALFDYNHNLDLLEHESNSWKRQLWLALAHPAISHLHFAACLPGNGEGEKGLKTYTSPKKQPQIREMAPVRVFGDGEASFAAEIPFSWSIKDHLDNWCTVALEQAAEKGKPMEEIFTDLVEKHYLGQVLRHYIMEENCTNFMSGYIHDFARMTYDTASDSDSASSFEYECIEASLKACVEGVSQVSTEKTVVQQLVVLHKRYRGQVATRLQHFAELIKVCPDLLQEEYQAELKTQGNEMILDAKAVKVLVERYLAPSAEEESQHLAQLRWLKKIQSVKVLVDNIIASVIKNTDNSYGSQSTDIIERIRPEWKRLQVLELFYEHVGMADERLSDQGTLVSMSFYGGADLKNIVHVQRVKEILTTCTENASTFDFKQGINEPCTISSAICSSKSTIVDPVVLPCDHIFCEKCIGKWIQRSIRTCPTCRAEVPRDFNLICTQENKAAVKRFQDFKRARNTFFFEIVSQLCFADNTPPDDRVVEELLKYVTGQIHSASPKEEVLFNNDTIDQDFTTQSVILQLLLQSCGDKADEFIDNFLREHHQGRSTYYNPEAMTTCLMYLYALENSIIADDSRVSSVDDHVLGATTKLRSAKDFLTIHCEQKPVTNIALLHALADARYGLIVTAQYIYDMSHYKETANAEKIDQLVYEAQTFCLESVCQQEAHLFLLKQLCHTYNTQILSDFSWHHKLSWILTPKLKGRIQRVFDGFAVSGAAYTTVRDALYDYVTTQSMQEFSSAIQDLDPAKKEEGAVLQAVFREVTLSNASLEPDMRATEEFKAALTKMIRDGKCKISDSNKDFAQRLVCNQMYVEGSYNLVVTPKQSYDHQMIIALVVHSLISIRCGPADYLREPLKKLLLQPRDKDGSQLLSNILKNSDKSTDVDGNPNDAMLRLIAFSITLGAAVDNARAVKNILPSTLKKDVYLGDYLWQGILSEMLCMKTCLRVSDKKCVLLLHLVLNNILTIQPQKIAADSISAVAKYNFKKWKRDFISTFIAPVTEDTQQQCLNAERTLQADEREVVLQVLHKPEPVDSATSADVQKLATLPAVWQYQPLLSVTTLHKYLEDELQRKSGQKQYELLYAFIQQEPILRAMIYLPQILQLQRLLKEQYHRCIDQAEARKISPLDDINEQTRSLMRSFIAAWNLVQRVEGNELAVSSSIAPQYKKQMALEECTLSVFLPISTGDGACSIELVKFLFERHNAFIQSYHDLRNTEVKRTISPGSVTASNLVAYDMNKDLLPLIHAHSCRALEANELTFNLDNLERAVEDHYIRGRPLIEGRVEELLFREGTLSSRVFQTIRQKVPQETLSIALRKDILSELDSITALRDCLAVSETVIGFLASTGGDPDMYVKDYLENVLSLPKEQQVQLNAKAHHCRLKHALSLWQILSVERAKRRLASKKQDPFEGIEKQFRKPLTKEEKKHVLEGLKHVDVEDYLTEFHEFIELQLNTLCMEVKHAQGEPPKLLNTEISCFLKKKGRRLHGFNRMVTSLRDLSLGIYKAVDVWCVVAQSKTH